MEATKTKVYHAVIQALTLDGELGLGQPIKLNSEPSVGSKLATEVIKKVLSRGAGGDFGVFKDRNTLIPSRLIEFSRLGRKPSELGEEFLRLSFNCAESLREEGQKKGGAKDGTVLFLHYKESKQRQFLAALLSESEGIRITSDLQPEDVSNLLDLNKLRHLVRINLDTLSDDSRLGEETSYAVFKNLRHGVAGYFVEAFGCERRGSPSDDTRALMIALERWQMHARGRQPPNGDEFVTPGEIQAAVAKYLSMVMKRLLEQRKQKGTLTPVSLEHIMEVVFSCLDMAAFEHSEDLEKEKDEIYQFLQLNKVPNEVHLDPGVLRHYVHVSTQTNDRRIKLETAKDLIGHDKKHLVQVQGDLVVIRSPELAEQLKKQMMQPDPLEFLGDAS